MILRELVNVAPRGRLIVVFMFFAQSTPAPQIAGLTCGEVVVAFFISLFASVVAVILVWLKGQCQKYKAAGLYCGVWDMYVFSKTVPRQLERDPENCVVRIERRGWFGAELLYLRAEHAPPAQPSMVRVWEGVLAMNPILQRRAHLPWRYTSPPGFTEFGEYELFLHDTGNLFVTPAVPPLQGDYTKFVLMRRVNS